MGMYGSSLLAFPEQFINVLYFQMIPVLNSGWDKKPVYNKRIIKHHSKPKQTKDQNGNLVISEQLQVWSMEKLNEGWFLQIENNVYRIGAENDFSLEDDFYSYDIERVIGDDGQPGQTVVFNTGTENFK